MGFLREESVFIAENWESVQDIVAALKTLDEDLFAVIKSLEMDLRDREWWGEGWQFHPWPDTAEVSVARSDWPWRKEQAVHIGIEGFSGERVFGYETPPQVYVWCPPGLTALVEELVARLAKEELPVGVLHREVNSDYVVTELLPQYASGSVDEYCEMIRERSLAFIDFYAQEILKHDKLIKRVIAKAEPPK